jgi:hypothetical protein
MEGPGGETMRSRKTVLLIVLAFVPAVVGVVSYLIETDQEAIERIVEEARRAFLSGDADRILKNLADGATAGGLIGNGPLAPEVVRWVGQERRRFADVSVRRREVVVEGDLAKGEWLVSATLRHGHGDDWPRASYQAVVAVEFERGPDGFRIRHAVARAP